MADVLAITALIVSIISALASLHLNRVKICGGCIESDCIPEKPKSPKTPIAPLKIEEKTITEI